MVHTSLSDKPSRVVLMSVNNNNGMGIDVSTRKPVQVTVYIQCRNRGLFLWIEGRKIFSPEA